MPCGKASINHKLKHLVIGKAKKPWLHKATKANCISVHYYNHKGAWMDSMTFENWFHKHFVPEFWAFLKGRCLPHRAVLLRDYVPFHLRESIMTSNESNHCKVFAPPPKYHSYYSAHGLRVTESIKLCYWADLLSTLADKDVSTILWKNGNVGYYAYLGHRLLWIQ